MNPTKKQWKYTWALIGFLFLCSGLLGQKPSEYKPTEVESLRLQVAQKDAIIAQQQMQQVQQAYQSAIDKLHTEAEKIKADHKWPETVKFNDQAITFYEVPKAEPAKPEAKKP